MSTYLFRNPNANRKINAFNRRIGKLKNIPLIFLFSFTLGFLASKAEMSLPKMRVISNELERLNDQSAKEKKAASAPSYLNRRAFR